MRTALLLVLTACQPLAPAPFETSHADSLDSADSAAPAGFCLGFEDGTLAEVGYPDDTHVQLDDGAILETLEEGGDWSALDGEEQLDFDGAFALLLRSDDEGHPESVAAATSAPFEVTASWLGWLQLSEVGKAGVWTGAELLDADDQLLASLDIPPRTGGFVPTLRDDQQPIEALPDLQTGTPTPGALVAQRVDMAGWLGRTVKLRLLQHTVLDGNGFFTVYDRICHDEGLEGEDLTWQDP